MRRVMGGVGFLVVALASGSAQAQESPGAGESNNYGEWEEDEDYDDGPDRDGVLQPFEDEDEDDGPGAQIVEVPRAAVTPQPATVAPRPVAVRPVATTPSLGSASRPASSVSLQRPAASGDIGTGEVEFDPYAERPVRAYLGAAGLGTFVLRQQPGKEALQSGGGLSIFAGVDLGSWIGLEIGYTGSFHNPGWGCMSTFSRETCGAGYLVMDLLSVDLRLHLPTGTHLVPFLQAGGLLGWMGRDNRVPASSGAGFEAGGGIEGWVGEYVTLGAKVLYRGVQVSESSAQSGLHTNFINLLTTSIDMGVHF